MHLFGVEREQVMPPSAREKYHGKTISMASLDPIPDERQHIMQIGRTDLDFRVYNDRQHIVSKNNE